MENRPKILPLTVMLKLFFSENEPSMHFQWGFGTRPNVLASYVTEQRARRDIFDQVTSLADFNMAANVRNSVSSLKEVPFSRRSNSGKLALKQSGPPRPKLIKKAVTRRHSVPEAPEEGH